MELTPRQALAWKMRQPKEEGGEGLTGVQIGERLGIAASSVYPLLRECRKKLGIGPLTNHPGPSVEARRLAAEAR